MAQDTPQQRLLLPEELALLRQDDLNQRVASRRFLVQQTGHLGSYWRWLRAERSLRQVAHSTAGVKVARLQQLEEEALPNPTLRTLLGVQAAYGLGSLDELMGPMPSARWAVLYGARPDEQT